MSKRSVVYSFSSLLSSTLANDIINLERLVAREVQLNNFHIVEFFNNDEGTLYPHPELTKTGGDAKQSPKNSVAVIP